MLVGAGVAVAVGVWVGVGVRVGVGDWVGVGVWVGVLVGVGVAVAVAVGVAVVVAVAAGMSVGMDVRVAVVVGVCCDAHALENNKSKTKYKRLIGPPCPNGGVVELSRARCTLDNSTVFLKPAMTSLSSLVMLIHSNQQICSSKGSSSYKVQNMLGNFLALVFLQKVTGILDGDLGLIFGRGNELAEKLISSPRDGVSV